MTPRVAYLCGEYPRATDTFIQREVAGLRNEGLHVETISVRRPSSGERGTAEQEQERSNTHYLLPCSPWRLLGAHFGLLLRHPLRYVSGLYLALTVRAPGLKSLVYQLFYFAEAGLLAAIMRKLRVRHVHNHAPNASGYVAMIGAQMDGFTYSMTLHGHGIFSEARRWNLTEKIERALFVICVSHHGRSQAMLWSDRRCWDKLYMVRCGINTDGIEPRKHTDRGRNILFVGRLDHVKGVPVLIEAFSKVAAEDSDVHLHIVGDGPERNELEFIVIESGLESRVSFYGYQSQAQIREHFAAADVFVMSSFVEGIPVVLMEAMAAGVPVVAPRITGIPELVRDGETGLLVTPGSVEALAERIQLLLADFELRNTLSFHAQTTVQSNFGMDTEVGRLAAIMGEQVAGLIHLRARIGQRGNRAKESQNAV